MKPAFASAAAWTQRYEAMRHHVLNSRSILSTDPIGLGWLREGGVAGWMRRWPDVEESTSFSSDRSVLALPLPAFAPEPHLLTVLLAQMTAQHLCPPSRL